MARRLIVPGAHRLGGGGWLSPFVSHGPHLDGCTAIAVITPVTLAAVEALPRAATVTDKHFRLFLLRSGLDRHTDYCFTLIDAERFGDDLFCWAADGTARLSDILRLPTVLHGRDNRFRFFLTGGRG